MGDWQWQAESRTRADHPPTELLSGGIHPSASIFFIPHNALLQKPPRTLPERGNNEGSTFLILEGTNSERKGTKKKKRKEKKKKRGALGFTGHTAPLETGKGLSVLLSFCLQMDPSDQSDPSAKPGPSLSCSHRQSSIMQETRVTGPGVKQQHQQRQKKQD